MKNISKKIKILYLHAGAELYGADKILLELLTNINKTEFEPTVILPNNGPLIAKIKDKNINVQVLPYPIVRRKFFTPFGILKYIFEYIKYGFILAKFVKKNSIDIVHINTTAVLEGAFIKVATGIPIVWHVHEIILSPKIMFKFFSLMIQTFSNQIVAVSEATRKRLLQSKTVKQRKIKTIYNGIESTTVISLDKKMVATTLKNKLSIPQNNKVVGMIGRINSWKGQEDFVKSLEIVFSKNKSTHAVIVGGVFSGEEYRLQNLKDVVSQSEYSDQIHIVDFSSNVSDFYALFDIFVLPSTRPDPFPTVVLEAMANKLPIVSYNHGGVTEMIEDGVSGRLVDVQNTNLLGKAVSNLLEDEVIATTFGNEAYKRQQKLFSINQFITNFEKVYKTEVQNESKD